MLKTEQVVEPKEVAATMECDDCHGVYDFKKRGDLLEVQEFLCLHRRTGVASELGEGKELHLDLCQHCFRKRLGALVTVKDPVTKEVRQGMDLEGRLADLEIGKAPGQVEDDEGLRPDPMIMPFPGEAMSGNPQEP